MARDHNSDPAGMTATGAMCSLPTRSRVASQRVSFGFPTFYTRILLERILYAYGTLVRQDLMYSGGDRQRGAPLPTARRTPSHNSEFMALSTTVQHMPQPFRTINALACQTMCKILFAVC